MLYSTTINMADMLLGSDLRFGCIRLENGDVLPLSQLFINVEDDQTSITFWGDTPEPWNAISLVSIQMFALPRGLVHLNDLIEHFSDLRKKRARLPEGVAFDEHTLAIATIPDGWTHEAFARSGRDLIHIYRSERQAVLVRFLGKAGDILDNPLLSAVCRHLSLVDGAWITSPPATEKRAHREPAVAIHPLQQNVLEEIQESIGRAHVLVGTTRTTEPVSIAEAIHQKIDAIRSTRGVTTAERKQNAIDLGALWGEALCAAATWEWGCIMPDADHTVYAVISPTHLYAVDPIAVAFNLLTQKSTTNNSLLLFNMVVSANLPPGQGEEICWLT